jgi:hypothetical protein
MRECLKSVTFDVFTSEMHHSNLKMILESQKKSIELAFYSLGSLFKCPALTMRECNIRLKLTFMWLRYIANFDIAAKWEKMKLQLRLHSQFRTMLSRLYALKGQSLCYLHAFSFWYGNFLLEIIQKWCKEI